MAKKRKISTLFTVVIFVLSIISVLYTTSKSRVVDTIAYINDGWVSWDNIEEIKIYIDGYYGRTMDDPVKITDKKEIKNIIKSVTDANGYTHIPQDEYLEGLCSVFVDFGNGCVISMYIDENYGTIDDKIQTTAEKEGYYKFPDKFRDIVFDILKKNEPAK
ncbi:MAG: hypothetical protein E7235_02980 [Lachnospiraceae bacterium]|nr:hypothetical protein [Lachnospiraceae bacterium]